MASTKTIDKRKAVLRGKGVPEAFVEVLAMRKSSGLSYVVALLIAFAGLSGFVWLQMTAWNHVALWQRQTLYGGISPGLYFSPGSPFDYFPLLSLDGASFMLVFGGLVVWMALFPERVRPWPAYNATASSLRTMGRGDRLKSIKPRPEFRQLGHLTSEVAFLEALIRNRPGQMARATIRLAVIFAVAVIALGVVAAQDYVRITDHLVEVHHAWQAQRFALGDVKQVETTCTQGSKDAGFHYTLVLPRQRLDLYPAPSISGADRRDALTGLGRVDAHLKALGIPDSVVVENGDTVDTYNACLAAWRSRIKAEDIIFPAPAPKP